jgi:hypothetical protein
MEFTERPDFLLITLLSEQHIEIITKKRDVPLFKDFSSLQPTDTAFFEGNGNIPRKGV